MIKGITSLLTIVFLFFVGVFVADYTGFDTEFGTSYHKNIKGKLIKKEILKDRKKKQKKQVIKDEQESSEVSSNIVGRALFYLIDKVLSAVLHPQILMTLIIAGVLYMVVPKGLRQIAQAMSRQHN